MAAQKIKIKYIIRRLSEKTPTLGTGDLGFLRVYADDKAVASFKGEDGVEIVMKFNNYQHARRHLFIENGVIAQRLIKIK